MTEKGFLRGVAAEKKNDVDCYVWIRKPFSGLRSLPTENSECLNHKDQLGRDISTNVSSSSYKLRVNWSDFNQSHNVDKF